MGALQWVVLFLNLVLASFSLLVAITVRSTYAALRKKLAQRSTRSLRELDSVLASHESTLASITTTVRRLSSRIGMQDVRARRKEESATTMPPNLDPAEKKAWLRKNLAAGKLRVIRDDPSADAR